jgi:hypothetical protein
MATQRLHLIRAEFTTPCVLREITDRYNLLRRLRYAILNDKFTPDDLKTAMRFGERALVVG